MPFPEAVAFLAERAGMQVPTPVGFQSNAESRQKRDRLYEILTLTAKFYYKSLMSDEGKDARTYLEKRGVDKNLMTRFGLGFSPSYDGVIKYLKEQGFSEAEMPGTLAYYTNDNGAVISMTTSVFSVAGGMVTPSPMSQSTSGSEKPSAANALPRKPDSGAY